MNKFIFILLIHSIAFGQLKSLSKDNFFDLNVYKDQYYCLPGWNGMDFFEKGTNSISLVQTESSDLSEDYEEDDQLKIHLKKIEYNKNSKLIEISGYINGGWHGPKSNVNIYVGKAEKQEDTVYMPSTGRPTYVDGKRIKKPYPIDTIESLVVIVSDSFRTEAGCKGKIEDRWFDISFTFEEKDLLIFGLSGCFAEIFDITKLLEE